MLRFLLLQMSELAVHPLAAAFHKVLAQRMIRFVVVADLRSIENVRRQLAGCPETLLLALSAMEELAARPITLAVLKIVAKGIFLHGIVFRTLVKIFAALSPVADISQKISTDPTRGVGDVSRVRVQSARHPDRLPMTRQRPRRPVVFQFYLQFFHQWNIAVARRRPYRCALDRSTNRLSAANTRAPE